MTLLYQVLFHSNQLRLAKIDLFKIGEKILSAEEYLYLVFRALVHKYSVATGQAKSACVNTSSMTTSPQRVELVLLGTLTLPSPAASIRSLVPPSSPPKP